VAPSLLAADFSRLGEEVAAVERGGADLLHLDVMDGQFVSDITLGPVVVRGIRKLTELFLDVHLMVLEPLRHLERFRAAGADSITVHAEACADLGATLAAVGRTGARVGLSLNPDTPLEPYRHHLSEVDVLLVMSVFPGKGGQAFMPEVLPKIEAARRWRRERGLDFAIEVDGGIDPDTAGPVCRAGADALVAGTAIFRHPPYAERIEALRRCGVPGSR
jgi:ribulose-phosphate 3-epimerase